MRGSKAGIEPHDEQQPDDLPAPPEWLEGDALKEWHRSLPILFGERRTLSVADLAIFANYCVAIGQVAESDRTLKKDGLTFNGPSGPKRHPAVAIRSDGMTQARQMAAELGLTPASRGRPSIKPGSGDGDEPGLFGLFGGHGL